MNDFIEKAGHSGIMVALYPGHTVQGNIAMEGGEPPGKLHVTLAYLPGIGEDQNAFDTVCEAVEAVAKEFAKVEGWIGGIGLFNGSESSDNKDVFYASYNAPGLPALRQAVVNAIDETGYEVAKKHGYTPHITLKYLDPKDPIPQERKKTSPFDILQLSVVCKLGRHDYEFTGQRVLKAEVDKDLPGSSVHVPTAGSEKPMPKKKNKRKREKELPGSGEPNEEKPAPAPVAPPADAHATLDSDLSSLNPVDILETEMLKAALDPTLLEEELPDPATADDAYPPDVALAMAGISKELTFSDVFDSIFGELLGVEPTQKSDDIIDAAFEKAEKAERIAKALDGRVCTIRKYDRRKQVVYCVVSEPHTVDAQDDWMTEEDIENTAHLYLLKSRVIGRNHEAAIEAAPVESYIAPQDLHWEGGPYGPQVVKKGSWVIGIKVFDTKEWAKVESGDYQGVSISGFGQRSDI